MGAAALTLRIIVATVIVITIGVIGMFGFLVVEPFAASFGNPPAALGWGDPGGTAVAFTSVSFVGLFLVLVIWFVAAPIRRDRRQQYR